MRLKSIIAKAPTYQKPSQRAKHKLTPIYSPSNKNFHQTKATNFFDELKDHFKEIALCKERVSLFNQCYRIDFDTHYKSFDKLQKRFPNINNSSDFIQEIENHDLDDETKKQLKHLIHLCIEANPKYLAKEFGEDFILYLFNKFDFLIDSEHNFSKYIDANTNYSSQLLLQAKHSYGIHQPSLTELKLAYDLASGKKLPQLQASLSKLLKQNQIKELPEAIELEKFSVASISLNAISEILHRGKVKEWYTEEQRTIGNRYYDLYLDSPYGLTLNYDGHPVAILGLKHQNGILEIHQMQGVNPYEIIDGEVLADKKLKPLGIFDKKKGSLVFDLRKLLVEMAESWAQINGIEKLMIQGAHNNLYIKPIDGETEAHLSLERAIEIYDKTADRLDYDYDEESKNWFSLT